ncbi:L-aspartate oxidase [Hazenella coriacea]|uniref:L-aspartate oxidase n=1 Tax=Hazenella coriacea TaxID=1179467 RepID=A0A4R3KZV0_9BACL|nr:L-aspartate oxidase [Hazenella coriacea]TCS92351.1 L-aspartate oxidase [Hazenella coriacea]
MTRRVTDFIVVGSGIAGLMTALSLAKIGEVVILTKAKEEQSNSFRAQGGIAAAVGENDSPELHGKDTLRTGVELCDPQSVDLLVHMGPSTIDLLNQWGTDFDREGDHLALGREGSHSVSRILHIGGDSTGAGITSSLLTQAEHHDNIKMITHTLVLDLWLQQGICRGVTAVDLEKDPVLYVAKKGVVLATGGCGQLYQSTTNEIVSTGDGFAMAYRAGALLRDMEFIQFHPTALAVEQNPMFLISEAVRGEGAILVNELGMPIMQDYHEWRDLAPRDVVSRAIYSEMSQNHQIYLDATSMNERFEERFPKIYHQCIYHGIHPSQDLIPVTPAAHFIMGGIQTDLYGQTTIPRLFACGEVACTGVHGANRLASNSLLEGAVFAQRVASRLSSLEPLEAHIEERDLFHLPTLCKDKQIEEKWKQKIKKVMWEKAGIVRSSEGLLDGIAQLKELSLQIPDGYVECRNMLITAQIIMKAALWREESRGGHYRYDFPKTLPEWASRHNEVRRSDYESNCFETVYS